MNRTLNFFLVLLVLAGTACSSSKGSGRVGSEAKIGTGKSDKVTEDLSVYRPRYEAPETAAPAARIEPSQHNNRQVAALMDTVATVNKNIKYAQGYRILAYNGSERQTVMNLRKSVLSRVPEVEAHLTYNQPNFRLLVGDFFSRVEAQEVLNKISDLMPNAQIVQDKITINKNY